MKDHRKSYMLIALTMLALGAFAATTLDTKQVDQLAAHAYMKGLAAGSVFGAVAVGGKPQYSICNAMNGTLKDYETSLSRFSEIEQSAIRLKLSTMQSASFRSGNINCDLKWSFETD